ncbi:arabinosyltransferase XEG113-like [Andrographis paniculata]|uniref:arabinosyltransferase XEG113-like n=1 Tax=Andrographis paniculata TaxID=175694 RepID=UPI0021E7F999|nr:arabinosyltransferase XEG113-like [Andrographis paniculata]
MALSSTLKEFPNYRPLFLTIYAVLMIGMVLSSLYVFPDVIARSNRVVSSFRFSTSGISGDDTAIIYSPSLGRSSNSSKKIADKLENAASQQENKNLAPVWKVPPGSKMPPLETFKLRKELVQERVKDNVIILTFGNFAFMDFILNWAKHLTDMGIHNLIVGAMDTTLLEALYWKGVPVFDMGSYINTTGVGWGSATFNKLGRDKISLLDSFLQFGFEILMCDTDTVWLKNPLPYLARYPEADVLVSTDQISPTVTGEQLDNWALVGEAYNIGIFHWRPTESSIKLVKEWREWLLANASIWDQDAFNLLVKRRLGPPVDEDSGLAYAYDGNLKLGLLPVSIFCSGHTYFVQAAYKQLRLEPYVVHTTFQFAGSAGKRHRMREAMLFHDPPEYYDAPGGFLTFKPDIPRSLLLVGEHTLESHFNLVNHQIKQIRTALAIATMLNRVLVMPPLWCSFDRLWFGHPGVLPASLTRQPFICPMDHVFEVHLMLKKLPEADFGPEISFREYSFFDNPSVPHQVKKSWVDVQLCEEGSHGCEISNRTNRWGLLKVPKQRTEEELKAIFSSFKDVKVIQFLTMQDAFSGFIDKAKEKRFRNRVNKYTGIWCCLQNRPRSLSHIYYDMYWDEKPGWKPIPPRDKSEDHPPLQIQEFL